MIYHILKNNITHKTYRIFRHRLKYSAYITHYQKENNRDQPPSFDPKTHSDRPQQKGKRTK